MCLKRGHGVCVWILNMALTMNVECIFKRDMERDNAIDSCVCLKKYPLELRGSLQVEDMLVVISPRRAETLLRPFWLCYSVTNIVCVSSILILTGSSKSEQPLKRLRNGVKYYHAFKLS